MEKLLQDTEFSDITFIVEGKELKCHKCIIACQSEYFRTWFLSGLASNKLEIKDVSFDIFIKLIKFIYTQKLKLTKEDFPEFVNLSELYLIQNLKEECIKFFKKTEMTSSYLLEITPYIKNINYIREYYICEIYSNWYDIITDEQFYNLINKDIDFLRLLLQSPYYNISKNLKHPIEQKDKEKILKILKETSENSSPEITNRILNIIEDNSLFVNPKNIEEFFKELKIQIPLFFKKYL